MDRGRCSWLQEDHSPCPLRHPLASTDPFIFATGPCGKKKSEILALEWHTLTQMLKLQTQEVLRNLEDPLSPHGTDKL
ncbi:hypothetical protein STEG23_001004 [Scotinomys teguina]